MKTLLIFLFSALLSGFLSAQITIQFADLPDIGNSLWQASDSTPSPNLSGSLSGGAGVTWNFTTGWAIKDTNDLTFVNTNTIDASISSQYPNANMACDQAEDSLYLFFTRNTTGIYIAGTYFYGSMSISGITVDSIATIYDQPELIVPVPFTYEDSIISESHYTIMMSIDVPPFGMVDVYQYSRSVKNMKCTGFGTLNTPSGSYADALLLRSEVTTYDTVYSPDPFVGALINSDTIRYSTNYTWVTNDQDQIMLMELGADSAGTTILSASYSFKVISKTDAEMNALNSIKFYPNPASDRVNLEIPGELSSVQVAIYSMDGIEVYRTEFNNSLQAQLDLSSWAKGMYLLELSTQNLKRTGKLVIAR